MTNDAETPSDLSTASVDQDIALMQMGGLVVVSAGLANT